MAKDVIYKMDNIILLFLSEMSRYFTSDVSYIPHHILRPLIILDFENDWMVKILKGQRKDTTLTPSLSPLNLNQIKLNCSKEILQ